MMRCKRHFSDSGSFEDKTNKLKKTFDQKSIISCFENLSNEIYYEIFEYLEGCQLHEGFSNLNSRFQNLLTSTLFDLKINVQYCSIEVFQRRYTDIIIPNRHKVVSFRLAKHLLNDFNHTGFLLDASFSRLKVLTLDSNSIKLSMKPTGFISFLSMLISLPCLVSLTIYEGDLCLAINNAYEIIFKLPKLKYCKFSSYTFVKLTDVPITTEDKFSRIEQLVIDHSCTFHALVHILSCTPQLRRLHCTRVIPSNENNITKEVNTISNLAHISFDRFCTNLNELERFILKKSPQLHVLRIGFFEDLTCLDADRWEQLISQYLTHLRIFEFQYIEASRGDLDVGPHHGLIQRFNSSFWIERKWLLRMYIDGTVCTNYHIIFSIFTHKKIIGDFHKNNENNQNDLTNVEQNLLHQRTIISKEQDSIISTIIDQTIELAVKDLGTFYFDIGRFFYTIGPVLAMIKIERLNIIHQRISKVALYLLIKYLPHLASLVISSLSMEEYRYLSDAELRNLRLLVTNNKISKVKLRRMNNLEESQFLLNLCRSIEYFEIDCTNGVDPEVLVRFILRKKPSDNPYLCSLCLEIPPNTENIVENLKKMIDDEQLREKYTIQQNDNRIYLQWT